MVVKFKWSGGRAPWAVRSAIADGQARAADRIKRAIRRTINIPFPPASQPGEPPHRRTGNLRRNVEWWQNRKTLTVQVGVTVDAPYGLFLEFGTRKMAARPFIRPIMEDMQSTIKNTMNRAAAIAFNKHAAKVLKR